MSNTDRHATEHELATAHHAGVAAALTSKPRASALDPVVRDLLEDSPVGEPRNIEIMDAWDRGYGAQIDRDLNKILEEGR